MVGATARLFVAHDFCRFFLMKSQAARIGFAAAALALSLACAAIADTKPCLVPEPGTFGLIGLGFAGLCLLIRRRRS
jgi:threonine dehydrogenase-like Zn-dependent dehydrogenase